MLSKQQAYRRRQQLKARFFDEVNAKVKPDTPPDKLGLVKKIRQTRRDLGKITGGSGRGGKE